MTSGQVRILVFMAWLCVVVNGACLGLCVWSDHEAEKAGVSVQTVLARYELDRR